MEDKTLTGLLQCNDCNNTLTQLEDECLCPLCNSTNIEEILK
jgi:Zn finger protein HypA/HybF involved in hydrogenase expression